MSDEQTPLTELAAAVQRFIATTEDEAALVVAAVLVVELATYGDNGEQLRRITYSTPSDLYSLSGTLGLLDAGLHIVRQDTLDDSDEL